MLNKIFALFIIGITSTRSQSNARCFSFTWLGPSFHNGSDFMNATCSEATRLSAGVPCFQPLVVSYDGSPPDVHYIWENHGAQASCVLAETDVCATYSYYFNGHVENVTHMCTRVEESAGRLINNGCYETISGNYLTRACFCRSASGTMPCNNSAPHGISALLVVMGALLTIGKTQWFSRLS